MLKSDLPDGPEAKELPPEKIKSTAVTLADAEPDQCRLPVGKNKRNEHLLCGARKSPYHPSYCEAHHKRSINPHAFVSAQHRTKTDLTQAAIRATIPAE